MRTDTLFYQLLKTFRSLLFELTEQPIPSSEDYEFVSVEVKEKAFRFDGIFLPQTLEQPIVFTEVQSQPKNNFYSAFMAEICMYLSQYEPKQDWQAVAIFARRSYDPGESKHFRELYASGRILRVYLEDWQDRDTDSWAIKIVQLIMASTAKTPQFVETLKAELEQESLPELQEKVVELIETVLVYKFPKLSREEIQAMFTLDDLRQTRVYQDAKQEGMQQGQFALVLRLLTRKFGALRKELKSQVEQLTTSQLENLAEAILDFDRTEDLETWLQNQP
jgi:predicted transposase/invertase (TIGR01784 family)